MMVGVAPASAQWTRVSDVPVTEIFSIRSNGDTVAALRIRAFIPRSA
jgi:hypothetical protein